jgi:hypothetical protein
VVILYFCSLIIPSLLFAAEVTNLRTHFSSSHLTIEYDLLGKRGEKDAGIEVALDIDGKRYAAHMLSLSGDFGRSVAKGKNRHITWLHPQDFPEGLDAKFNCIVNAVPDHNLVDEGATPSEGFRSSTYAINRQTVVETRTKLMWTRNANIPIKPMTFGDAEKMIQRLNQNRYAGYNDWRMPTREDFEGLVSLGAQEGWVTGVAHFIADYLATCGFSHIQPGYYWTATTAKADKGSFIVANTWNGMMRPLSGSNFYYLWPVRSVR